RKHLASHSAYMRRVGADLSVPAARVAISAGWGATRRFELKVCTWWQHGTCRFSLLKRLAGIAQMA
ncbi:hypothetical protein OAB79_00490, partial [Yoonia sp.]|nr:hypothetical protein [Yoonia sp.]